LVNHNLQVSYGFCTGASAVSDILKEFLSKQCHYHRHCSGLDCHETIIAEQAIIALDNNASREG